METDRRTFLQKSAVALAGAPAVFRPGTSAGSRPPNIVFAFSDEHRWQSMSFTELPQVHTPNMARLAAEGAHFTHCISNYPVCSPCRAIMMTGRWPYRQKMRDAAPGMIDNAYALSPAQVTLGHVFRQAGYRTGYVGKWHMGGTRAEPFGFDDSMIWTHTNNHWQSRYHPSGGGPAMETKGYNATLMTDQALEFIDRNRDRPFFLMLSWNPPHSDFLDAPEDKQLLYRNAGTLPYRPNVQTTNRAGANSRRVSRRWAVYRGYHAHVSAVDAELGRLLDRLDEWKLAENTVVVYTSDHGSMLGSHNVGGKRQPYEESIRVPFLVRWPRRTPAGRRLEALFGAIDIFPTLCALAGIEPPAACDGQDFSGWLSSGRGPSPESQFIMHIAKEHASGGLRHPAPLFRGVTAGRWTYAHYPGRPWCLFDNRKDPYQLENRIDDATLSAVRLRLRGMLDQWLRRADDPIRLQR
ncbi:MAG: sulfatase [Kiritimatiellaeota bacterium]|nr:sulfatase [Kiritimatiellota bacterium]